MTYLDKYPGCIGCPVIKYCGTMVSSTRLCHSYNDNLADSKSFMAVSNEMTKEEFDDYASNQIAMQLEVM